jgi:hypothetical protein
MLWVLNALDYFKRRFHSSFPKYTVAENWRKRIDTVKASPDNNRLHHVPEAGALFADHQLMANGLKITLGSYYDYGNTHLLIENKGVHEPQEEFAFTEVLTHIKGGSAMMELGSYWAFYSMWFAKAVQNARCIMIEPDPHKMNFGQLNFKLNGYSGVFELGFITDNTNIKPSIPSYSVDFLMKKHSSPHLAILHSDIQGYELKMLEGASEALRKQSIDYFFISTHSNELHQSCIEKLKSFEYLILCEANLDQSYSVDGLIVAKSPIANGPGRIEISKRDEN